MEYINLHSIVHVVSVYSGPNAARNQWDWDVITNLPTPNTKIADSKV